MIKNGSTSRETTEWTIARGTSRRADSTTQVGKVVHVAFWDADGREIAPPEQQDAEANDDKVRVFLGDFAVDGWLAYVHEDEAIVPLPEHAEAISLRVFRLHTGKAPIPKSDE